MYKRRYVIDTTAIISYFDSIFEEKPKVSQKGLRIIRQAFQSPDNNILIIPSIVFIEIFEKWIRDDEFQAKVRAEILEPVKQAPNIEIRPVDVEVLEHFVELVDPDIRFDNHDRLILASAVSLNAPLITSDRKISKFVARHHTIPKVIQ